MLRVGALLRYHVFIGMLLVRPIVLKIGSTVYRFVRYYAGSPAYRRKGPPRALLRVLGPLVVVLTIVLFASGIGVSFSSAGLRRELLFVHRISFFLWFAAVTVHVLGHIRDTSRLAPGDFDWRTRKQPGKSRPAAMGDRRQLGCGSSPGCGLSRASWSFPRRSR